MLCVGNDSREDRAEGVVDGREDLPAAEHARRPALGDKYAIWCQLGLHD